MLKKEFLNKNIIIKLLLINLIILFFSSMIFIIMTPQEASFGVLEWLLTILILSITTIYYKKYSNPNLLKRIKINSKSKKQLQLNLFFIVFIYGILIILFFLLWIFLINLFLGDTSNMFDASYPAINWNNFSFSMYFYYSILELVILISFAYFLNHFIKNINFILGIIIMISVWSFLFGNIFMWYFKFHSVNGEGFFKMRTKGLELFVFTNTFILPWFSIGSFGKNIFMITDNLEPLNWFDMSQFGDHAIYFNGFTGYLYTPYIYLLFYLAIPFFHSIFITKD